MQESAKRSESAGAAVGLALYGAFSAPLTIWGQALRMKIIPSGFHSRCFAIMRTLMQSGGAPGATPDEAALDTLCLNNIARFKRPKAYRFVDTLPKNNYAKILKTQLRKIESGMPKIPPHMDFARALR